VQYKKEPANLPVFLCPLFLQRRLEEAI
jgi:hypothetical protein